MKLMKSVIDKSKEKVDVDKVKKFINTYSKILQPLMFIGGFVYDSITMTRVDSILDNLIFSIYLIVLGFIHWLQIRTKKSGAPWPWAEKYKHYFPLLSQFMFGALMSGYLIFYFHSASGFKAFVFILFLAAALIGNEFIEKKYSNHLFFNAFYFFSLISFFLFFIPVIVKRANVYVFYASIFLAVIIITGLWIGSKQLYTKEKLKILYKESFVTIILIMSIGLSILYHTNWIPPVPLSLKKIGIYKDIQKSGDTYELAYNTNHWFDDYKNYNSTIYYKPGDAIYCFSAIFGPGMLKQDIIHQWEWKNPVDNEWVMKDTISYELTGGRAEGWRGYTFKKKIKHGDWRVLVKTPEDKLIGKIDFNVVHLDTLHKAKELYIY